MQRTPTEAYGTAYRWAVRRVGPARWLLGALLLPGTPAAAVAASLPVAAWEDLDSVHDRS